MWCGGVCGVRERGINLGRFLNVLLMMLGLVVFGPCDQPRRGSCVGVCAGGL